MKGKFLLVGFGMSVFLFTIYQASMQIVLAEVKESTVSTLRQETTASIMMDSTSSSAAQESIASTIYSETSLMGESKGDETQESTTSNSNEQKERTEETLDSSSSVLEIAQGKIQTALPTKKVEENYQFSVSKNQTTEAFIQVIGKDAQAIAWQEDLYASVMIAQAILETGSGNSQLARPPYHNLFGIKGSYQGENVSFKTQEDKGNGQLYTIQAVFRRYPSYKESLGDYAALLKNGLSGNTSFYQGTWKSTAATYQEAAKALTGKYATDTSYDKKLIALIKAYKLNSYDQNPEAIAEAEQEQPENEPVQQEGSSEEKKAVERLNESSEQELKITQTAQPTIMIPPTAQRPAKQLSGNQPVQ